MLFCHLQIIAEENKVDDFFFIVQFVSSIQWLIDHLLSENIMLLRTQ